nr:hypothetical protein [Dehalococcoidales bacterium]
DEYVDRYVSYYALLATGIPKDWARDKNGDRLSWYVDDCYLIEHPAFYENVYLGLMENEPIDFTNLPSREVFDKYSQYVNLIEGKPRDDFRAANRDLEEWLLLTKKVTTPIWEKKRRSKLTPAEQMAQEIQYLRDKIRTP